MTETMNALKPQDLLVMLKVVAHPPKRWTYAALGASLSMSASEVHSSVRRATAAGLVVTPRRGEWAPVKANLLEFMVHGARYIWPAVAGPIKRGIPTSFGTEPLSDLLSAASGEAPVWAFAKGHVKGPALVPLYRTAPQAAMTDPALHRLLALLDALRAGRVRERTLAGELLEAELAGLDAANEEPGNERR